jgi:anti-anti-sigma factor
MTAEATAPDAPNNTGGAPWSCEVVQADPLVISVGGEVDTLTGPLVRDRMVEALDASSGPVRIEMADVSFIDSQGLSTLITVRQSYPDRAMTLAGARPNVRRLLEITGLEQTFSVE